MKSFLKIIFRLSDKPLKRRFESNKWNRPMNQMSSHMAAFSNFDKIDGYQTFGDVPPPLPPRNIYEIPRCCNSDICECYCEL